MAYAERSDIDSQYGVSNVSKWADLENEEDEDHINERVAWALAAAQEDVNDRLRLGAYTIPFDEPPPSIITRLTAIQAGILLYESRGVTDYDADGNAQDQLQKHRKTFDTEIRDILVGRRKLSTNQVSASYPQVITDADCEE